MSVGKNSISRISKKDTQAKTAPAPVMEDAKAEPSAAPASKASAAKSSSTAKKTSPKSSNAAKSNAAKSTATKKTAAKTTAPKAPRKPAPKKEEKACYRSLSLPRASSRVSFQPWALLSFLRQRERLWVPLPRVPFLLRQVLLPFLCFRASQD